MFGGKRNTKKAQQKREQKSKKYIDYSKIKLNKVNTDSTNSIKQIQIKNNVIRRIYDEESLNANIEKPSVEYKNDFINVDNTYYKYKHCIELQCKDNKSRDSECDMNEDEDEEHNELIINDNDNGNGDSPACSEIFSICSDNEIANEEIDLNDTQFGNDLFLDMNNINDAMNARESEIESPSISNQTDSPSFEYEYNVLDITTIGAIKTPKSRTPIVENEPEPIIDLLGNTYGIYNESSSSDSDIEQHEENTNNNYDINNIGYIGAIHTNEFIKNKNFNENRQKSIHSDLLDMIESDSDVSYYDNDNEEEEQDDEKHYDMTIMELLNVFKMSASSFMCYFNKILCIQYVNQIINYEPNIIKRGLICNNIQIQINTYKMLKYLSKQVINGNLNGLKSKQWIELENNTIYNIFGYKSNYLLNYENIKNNINQNNLKYKNWDYIILNNFDREYINISVPCKIKIIVEQLPDKYKFEPSLLHIGVEDQNEPHISNLYIDDRLTITQNDKYENTMNFGDNWIENESAITITLKPSAQTEDLAVDITHEPRNYGACYKSYNYTLPLNKPKLFIQQFNGIGKYSICCL